MKLSVANALWKFPPFRNAVRKEAMRFLLGVTAGLALAFAVRYSLDWMPGRDGLLSIGIGILAIIAMWLVSVVRTIRAVLREHGLLER